MPQEATGEHNAVTNGQIDNVVNDNNNNGTDNNVNPSKVNVEQKDSSTKEEDKKDGQTQDKNIVNQTQTKDESIGDDYENDTTDIDKEIEELEKAIEQLESSPDNNNDNDNKIEYKRMQVEMKRLQKQIEDLSMYRLQKESENEVKNVIDKYGDMFDDVEKELREIINIASTKGSDLETAAKTYLFDKIKKDGVADTMKLNKTRKIQDSEENQAKEKLKKLLLS